MPGTGSLLELLHAGPAAIVEAVERVEWATGADAAPPLTVSFADVEPLAPIPNPPSLRDAMTFETHGQKDAYSRITVRPGPAGLGDEPTSGR